MRVSVNRSACSGTGMCVELCPEVFGQDPEYIAYVKSVGARVGGEAGVSVPDELRDGVLDAADACPTRAVMVSDG